MGEKLLSTLVLSILLSGSALAAENAGAPQGGSSPNSSSDAMLSPGVSGTAMSFDKMDTNHDGKVGKTEYEAGMKMMHDKDSMRDDDGMHHGDMHHDDMHHDKAMQQSNSNTSSGSSPNSSSDVKLSANVSGGSTSSETAAMGGAAWAMGVGPYHTDGSGMLKSK